MWGTPEQVTEKLLDYVTRCDAGGLVVPLSFGGMSTEEAHASFDLFAAEVLPELQRHDVGGDLGVTYGAEAERGPCCGVGASRDVLVSHCVEPPNREGR